MKTVRDLSSDSMGFVHQNCHLLYNSVILLILSEKDPFCIFEKKDRSCPVGKVHEQINEMMYMIKYLSGKCPVNTAHIFFLAFYERKAESTVRAAERGE